MMRMSFGNMTLEFNIFNTQRQPSHFYDIEFSTLNWVEDSIFDDDFDDMFAIEYESFLVDEEGEYDVFEFDDLCCTADYLLGAISKFAHKSFSSPSLELKSLSDSLKYAFLGPNELLHVIIAFDLDRA